MNSYPKRKCFWFLWHTARPWLFFFFSNSLCLVFLAQTLSLVFDISFFLPQRRLERREPVSEAWRWGESCSSAEYSLEVVCMLQKGSCRVEGWGWCGGCLCSSDKVHQKGSRHFFLLFFLLLLPPLRFFFFFLFFSLHEFHVLEIINMLLLESKTAASPAPCASSVSESLHWACMFSYMCSNGLGGGVGGSQTHQQQEAADRLVWTPGVGQRSAEMRVGVGGQAEQREP